MEVRPSRVHVDPDFAVSNMSSVRQQGTKAWCILQPTLLLTTHPRSLLVTHPLTSFTFMSTMSTMRQVLLVTVFLQKKKKAERTQLISILYFHYYYTSFKCIYSFLKEWSTYHKAKEKANFCYLSCSEFSYSF